MTRIVRRASSLPLAPAWLPVVVLALTLAGCGAEDAPPAAEVRVRVMVSLPPLAWLVERVGGEHVEVRAFLAPGDSPATYLPTDAQVSWAVGADLYVRSGVPFERGPWLEALRGTDLPIVDLRDGVDLLPVSDGHAHDHPRSDPENADPHAWLDPGRLRTMAGAIASALTLERPDLGPAIEARLAALDAELVALDAELRRELEPLRGSAFFVFHPSWGYVADAYGLRQVAVEVAGQEPSDRELTELQALARSEGARVVFVQPQITGAAAAAVAQAIGGEVVVLDPLVSDVPANLRRVAAELVRAGLE